MAEWHRDTEQSVGIAILSVIFGMGMLVISVVTFSSDAFTGVIIFAEGAVGTWFGLARGALAGARPERTGLRIRNLLRTRVVPWSEIAGIRVGSHGIYPRIAVVDLWDGRRVHIWGLQGPLRFFRPKSQWKLDAKVASLHQLAIEAAAGRAGEVDLP